jgi:hypothetical protein
LALDLILSAVVVISFACAERVETNWRLWRLPAVGVLVGGVSFGLPLLLSMREVHRQKSFAERAG